MAHKITLARLVLVGLLSGFTPALGGDPYTVLPGAIPDGSGPPPVLSGLGSAIAGSKNTLTLTQGPPQRAVHLVVGMSLLNAPFSGGVLGPAPELIATIGRTDSAGSLTYQFRMPEDAPPGLSIWTQAWMRASGAPEGLAATNPLEITVQPEFGPGDLYPLATYPMGLDVRAIAAADLNGDGLTDIVSANGTSGLGLGLPYDDVTVRLGTSLGTFSSAQLLSAGSTSTAVAIGNVMAGDEPDIIIANEESSDVSIFPGLGLGAFGEPVHEPVASGPGHVSLADLDGDGHLDIVTASVATGTLSVLLSLDGSTLEPAKNYQLAANPSSIAIGDLNLDQVPDLALVDSSNNQLAIHYGDGSGGFSMGQVLSVQPGSPRDVLIGNLDTDQRNELIVIKGGANSVLVYDAGATDDFALTATLPAGIGAQSAHLSDLDEDGYLDLAVARGAVHRLTVMQGIPAGYFEAGETFAVSYESTSESAGIVSDDVNQDGCTDLVVASGFAITVFLADGEGSFFANTVLEMEGTSTAVARGDFDGDGVEDYATSGTSAGIVRFFKGTRSGPAFAADTAVGVIPWDIAVGDLDADGILDLAVSHLDGEGIRILKGNGDFSFNLHAVAATGPQPREIALVDVTGDALLDLIAADSTEDRLSILPGVGDGTFSTALEIELCESPSGLVVKDLTGDGQLDIAVACSSGNAIRVMTNEGGGAFSEPMDFPGGLSPRFVDAFDIDGDSDLDLLATSLGGFGVVVLKNAGDGTFPGSASNIPSGGASGRLAFADVTGDGLGDLIVAPGVAVVIPGLGGGLFGEAVLFAGASAANDVVAADVDGDGDVDLLIPDRASSPLGVVVLENHLNHRGEQ